MPDISAMYCKAAVMLKSINKKSYAMYMTAFREKYETDLNALLESAERDGPKAAAEGLVKSVAAQFSVRGKIPGYLQTDLNSFTVYYVMPALELSGHPQSAALIDEICAAWEKEFRRSTIRFASYETILNAFQNAIFGIRF